MREEEPVGRTQKASGSWAPGSRDGAFLRSLSLPSPRSDTSYTNSSPDPSPRSVPGWRLAAPFGVPLAAWRGRARRAQCPPEVRAKGAASAAGRNGRSIRWTRGKRQGHVRAAGRGRQRLRGLSPRAAAPHRPAPPGKPRPEPARPRPQRP